MMLLQTRTWNSIFLSLNLKVHGFTLALLIRLLCSISILWSIMSSSWSEVLSGNWEPFLLSVLRKSYFCLL